MCFVAGEFYFKKYYWIAILHWAYISVIIFEAGFKTFHYNFLTLQ